MCLASHQLWLTMMLSHLRVTWENTHIDTFTLMSVTVWHGQKWLAKIKIHRAGWPATLWITIQTLQSIPFELFGGTWNTKYTYIEVVFGLKWWQNLLPRVCHHVLDCLIVILSTVFLGDALFDHPETVFEITVRCEGSLGTVRIDTLCVTRISHMDAEEGPHERGKLGRRN